MLQRIIPVAIPPRIKDKHRTKPGPGVSCPVEVFSFDVIDDNRVFPGEKLCCCMQSFAMPRRGDDDDVAKLPPVWDGCYGKHLVVGPDADKQMGARFRLPAVHEACNLMRVGKAGFVDTPIRSDKERGAGEPSQKDACGKHQVREGLKRGYSRSTSLPIVSSSFGFRTISVPIPWSRVIVPQVGQ